MSLKEATNKSSALALYPACLLGCLIYLSACDSVSVLVEQRGGAANLRRHFSATQLRENKAEPEVRVG